jgi:hypothetical protein
MVATLVGMGMGPLAVGLVSDGFAGESEATSLMWGLIAITAIAPLSAIAYLIASRNLREDLRRAAEQAGS